MTFLRRRSPGALLALVLAFAAPAAARAARPHSVQGVASHLHSADRALGRLTARPAGPLAAMYLARIESQTALTSQLAGSIVADAHSRAARERAATVLGLLADHQTSDTASLTAILGSVRPELEAAVAQAIASSSGGRQGALETLNGLLGKLSPSAKPVVAQIVALESTQGAQVPVQLASALGANSLACSATGAVQQALVVSTEAFQLGLAGLGPALALVPPAVQAQVQREIDGVPALLTAVKDQLASIVPCSPAPSSAAPAVAAVQAPTLLGGMTQLIDGILGRLLPGLAAGQAPQPLSTPAPLQGLLGGLLG